MKLKEFRKKLLKKLYLVDAKDLDKLRAEVKYHMDYQSTLVQRINEQESTHKKEVKELKDTISRFDEGVSSAYESLLSSAKSLQGLYTRNGLTKSIIDRMPTDEYRHRLQNEPGFRQAVDRVLEAK